MKRDSLSSLVDQFDELSRTGAGRERSDIHRSHRVQPGGAITMQKYFIIQIIFKKIQILIGHVVLHAPFYFLLSFITKCDGHLLCFNVLVFMPA